MASTILSPATLAGSVESVRTTYGGSSTKASGPWTMIQKKSAQRENMSSQIAKRMR